MNLIELQNKIHKNAKEKGFWDMEHNFGNDLMLIVGELGECSEAHRNGEFANLKEFENIINSDESVLSYNEAFRKYVKDTVEDELADALIRILDCAKGWGINLEKHVHYKMKFNESREKLHGKKY
jgi:NTP pyrophosphatase (non-canonical NTP hydrolase)